MMSKRILVCEFHQESNTFNPIVNGIGRFNAGDVLEGERPFRERLTHGSTVHGATDAIREAGGEVYPTALMRSGSGGRVSDEAFAFFCQKVEEYIRKDGDFDAVYAELHGATCTESLDDACGEFLERLRNWVGDKPIVASCDLHAKITEKMLRNADTISGYQTYPHIDLYETGYRAGKLCMQLLAGEKLSCAACRVPMLVPPAGYTDKEGAFGKLMDRAKAMVKDGKLEDFSVFVVQPWLDVEDIQSCVLAIGKDPETAKAAAADLAKELYDIREEMWPELVEVDAIIDIAEANQSGKPVILADSADSPNGGAVGDSPAAVARLLERGSTLKAAACIRDAAAVEQAWKLGIGATGMFSVGASLTPGVGKPLVAEGTVLSLHENPVGSKHAKMGKAAVVQFGSMTVILGTNGDSTRLPEDYRDFGIEPKDCQLVVVKANTSFRAFYAPITDLIYVADTPGAGASNLLRFDWKNVPKDMYPFRKNREWHGDSYLW